MKEAELEKYKNRAYAGRKKHDSAWMQSYNAFVVQYEKGKTIMEIVEQGDISRRTAYTMMKSVQTESNFRGLTVQILKEATCIVLHRQSGRFAGE